MAWKRIGDAESGFLRNLHERKWGWTKFYWRDIADIAPRRRSPRWRSVPNYQTLRGVCEYVASSLYKTRNASNRGM